MQHHPSESFVTRFESLAGTSTKRHVDLELRFLDVIFALVFGLLALPLALVIGAVVAATSGQPVLYRGERVGRGGRIFTILKFRTLRRDAATRRRWRRSSRMTSSGSPTARCASTCARSSRPRCVSSGSRYTSRRESSR